MKILLVAHDFDDTSERALDTAIDLARKLSARVVVTHVFSVPVYNFPEGSSLIPSAEDAARISAAAQRHLDGVIARRSEAASGATGGVRRTSEPGVPIEGVLRSGVPEEEICRLGDELGADMIVIGTHARGALQRALLGSVAERVVRAATRPVLTVRGLGHRD